MTSNVQLPIGIFDSGLGGLTVAGEIHKILPREDLVYLGDTARVPYGTKAPSTVIRFALEDMEFLHQRSVKAVVIACNTVSAWALPTLEQKYSIPILGVIEPGAQAALEQSKNHRIGVIGTHATIKSQAYERSILARDLNARVFCQATPLLVPLVEEGWMEHPVTLAVLKDYLAPLLEQEIDTLVLGCTHYPLLKKAVRQVAGKGVALVDSASSCARFVQERLGCLGLLNTRRKRTGTIHPFVTDEAARFDSLVREFLGIKMEPSQKVTLPS
jgi:glutamate racemase